MKAIALTQNRTQGSLLKSPWVSAWTVSPEVARHLKGGVPPEVFSGECLQGSCSGISKLTAPIKVMRFRVLDEADQEVH